MNLTRAEAAKLVAKAGLVWCDPVLVAPAVFTAAKTAVLQALKKFHDANPLVAGMSKEELRGRFSEVEPVVFGSVFDEALRAKKIELAGELVRLAGHGMVMKDEEAESKKVIEDAFAKAGLKVPALKDVLSGLKVE